MKLTAQELAEIRNFLPACVTDNVVQRIADMTPEGISFQMVAPMIAEAAEGLPANADEEIVFKKIMAKMSRRGKAEKGPNPGDSKKITRDYFDSLLVEQRLIDSVLPTTETVLFGEKIESPIMTAALSHLHTFHRDWENPMEAYAEGAKKAGVLHWVGMSENDEFERIMATGARTVRIVKPYADKDKIISQIEFAKHCGATAVGIDIDHTFTQKGKLDVVMGEPMTTMSSAQLYEFAHLTDLPFVLKGVLSVQDAVKAKELGASGIVVSHHGGRIQYAVPPVKMLPEIRAAVGDDMTIIVDCGVQSGLDAYKALALGANGVSVGNHLIPLVKEGGADAVADRLIEMNQELKGMMASTGVKDCSSFDPTVIHR